MELCTEEGEQTEDFHLLLLASLLANLGELSHNKASGGPVVVDGAQDGDLDAV